MLPDTDFLARLEAVRPADREQLITERVLALVVTFLGFDDDEQLFGEDHFLELGFDSLRAVEFKILLEEQLACELPATLLFDCATPLALAGLLNSVLFGGDSSTVLTLDVRAAEPLAIVGMACRFPGGAEGPDGFWSLCKSGRDAIQEVPSDRWDVDAYYAADPEAPGRMNTRWGGFLDRVGDFDAAFFGISPREARAMDPAQRILLESAWHALENANIPPSLLRGSATGVFIGTRGADYFQGQTNWAPEDATRYFATGNAASTLAGRLSFQLGLTGPCFALDTACSSSLVALHQAALSLEAGECDTALVGGVNVILDPFGTIAIAKAQMLAPDGRCKAFSAAANGYVRSEGCGVIVLKKLADAEASGDRILAIVRGSAINQDGASAGLTVPSSAAQTAVIRQALVRAKLEPDAIDFIEAHGTGTSLGDPIEVAALDAVFKTPTRKGPLALGTIKTQIGHSEPAAGIAGLIRVVLSLRHETLTANLHFDAPNPLIPWDTTVVSVLDAERPWPRDPERPRRAGVNSFGFSGTNAHVVLEEAPVVARELLRSEGPVWLPLSAKSPAALADGARQLAALIESGEPLVAIARALLRGRDHHAFRASVVASDKEEVCAQLASLAPAKRVPATAPKIAFLFTGQGSQFAGMGAELYASSPVFRDAFDEAAQACAPLDLVREIFDSPTQLDETHITQPALFAIEYALAKLWSSYGIEPAWVLGHSVGEFAAAVIAGALTLEDAGRLIVARGQLMAERTPPGAMLAVLAAPAVVEPLTAAISDQLAIAAHNCDARLSVSGPADAIDTLAAKLDELGERYERLAVTRGFHSPLMDPMLDAFNAVAATATVRTPTLGFMSTLEAAPVTKLDAAYWTRHVREPVRFQDAMLALESEGIDAFVEIGPAPHLLGLARRFLQRDAALFLPSMRPGKDPRRELFSSLGALYARGATVARGDAPAHAALPLYPFQRQRFWLAPKEELRATNRSLLGEAVDSSRLDADEALFAQTRTAHESDPLRDHCVLGQPIFPAAAYVAMLAQAAASVGEGEAGCAINGLKITAALPLGSADLQLETSLKAEQDGRRPMAILAKTKDGSWRTYASAQAVAPDSPRQFEELAAIAARCRQVFTSKQLYARVEALGLEYGPAFQTVTQLATSGEECLARIEGSSGTQDLIDPAVLDGCFQTTTYVVPDELATTPFLPLGLDRLELFAPLRGNVQCHARRTRASGRVVVIDLAIYSESGESIASIQGLRLLATDRATLLAIGDPLEGLAFTRSWPAQPLPVERHDHSARVCVVRPGDAPASELLASELADALSKLGLQVADTGASRGATDVIDLTGIGADAEACLDAKPAAGMLARLATPPAESESRARLWLVTRGAMLEATDPAAAAVWGFARALELEEPRRQVTALDLDPLRNCIAELAGEIAYAGPEREVAWRDGVRHVARLVRGAEDIERKLTVPTSSDWRLAIQRFGSLDALDLVHNTVPEPGPDDVTIEVEAAAINFKDVLFALGMLQDHTGITRALEQPLGHECAGRIVALGKAASERGRLKPGQAVFVAAHSAMQSRITVPERTVCPKPSGLSMAAAAGLPTVFLTVMYGLERVAHIGPGDRILIHAAAGGVGLAALEIARHAGAEVFATASRGKWAFLKSLGVQHVFDSRSFDYKDEVLAATNGRGVDIVLDSMAGDHVAPSLACLSDGGRFIELGKIGVWQAAEIAEARPDVDYALFDMAEVLAADPLLHTDLLQELVHRVELGEFKPIPTKVFAVEASEAAFRHLASARNIGKVALRFPERREPTIDAHKAYVITGGLGALGLHVASWLAREGAGELLLLGRQPANDEALAKLRLIERTAPSVRLLTAAVDVTDFEALRAALATLELPLAGVLHAAGVLDDALARDLDAARFQNVLDPKWRGAWNLHLITRAMQLDFFVLFSSMTAMVGAAGQANYAAANAGLDAFAAWRRGQGLVGTSFAWGPWSGGGMATRAAQTELLDAAGIGSLSPEVATAALAGLIARPGHAASVGILAVDWPRYLERRAALPVFEGLKASETQANARQETRAVLDLSGLDAKEREAALRSRIQTELAAVLGFASAEDVDTAAPFTDLGIDSLIAVDLRNRLEAALGCELPVTLLFDHDHLDSLIAHLSTQMAPAQNEEARLAAEIAELSDEEVARLLAEEESLG